MQCPNEGSLTEDIANSVKTPVRNKAKIIILFIKLKCYQIKSDSF